MKLGASVIGRRLFQSAATSALALSALAGGVMLSGGEAKAVDSCTPQTPTGNSCTFNEPGISGNPQITDTLTIIQGFGAQTEHLDLTGDKLPDYQTTIDINNGANPPFAGIGIYNIDKFPGTPNLWFDKVRLQYIIGTGNPTVTKEVCAGSYLPNGNCNGTILGTISTNGGVLMLPNKYSSIGLKDTVVGGTVNHINNDLRNVPGPLPILGAGAAFGFSRKLRGRIKASRTA